MDTYLWLFVAIALAAIGTIGTFGLLHARANRRRWSRYAVLEGAGKFVPVLCPHCRQRSYSPRAIQDRFCPNCEKHY